ncbi:MAG: hypothetical protein IKN12_02785 [Selenomonadaceae bacterium]|nr:hypothetical protein [Selenomonadaceae bacterium]
MDIITRVRTAKNKLALMGGFALIGSMAYANYSVFPMLLFVSLFIFADMMEEDAKYTTVDIRKAGALGLFFLIASKEPVGNFLLTALLAVLFFRIVYLLAILKYSKREKDIEVLGKDGKNENPIGLLPSFGIAFFLLGLYLQITHQSEPIFLLGFKNFLIEIGNIFSGIGILWILFLVLWIQLEIGVRWYKKKQDVEIVEGLGLGDVIVFPFFVAFLGITPFLFVLFLGCIIHLLQYMLRYIYIKKE